MRDAWKGLKILTGHDQTKEESPLLTEEGSGDRLNSFYARFDNIDFCNVLGSYNMNGLTYSMTGSTGSNKRSCITTILDRKVASRHMESERSF